MILPVHSLSIAVCGGGIAGLAVATLLARAGHRPIVFEARDEQAALTEGAFLTIAPNGRAALNALGVEAEVVAAGMATRAIAIGNHRGKRLACIEQVDGDGARAESITIGRGALARILARTARTAGAEIRHGVRLRTAIERSEAVTLDFGPAGTVSFDLVAAADGLSSVVRTSIFPASPRPRYGGLVGTGGIDGIPGVAPTDGIMNMTFGRQAFFGYQKTGDGPVHWFNSFPVPERDLGEVDDPSAFTAHLRGLHAGDPEPVRRILSAIRPVARYYPIQDMPPLPTWHTGRVVLLGDAAHAVAPHAGQGASMALEDAVVLAACLREETTPLSAFVRFERLRRGRTRAVMETARRNGTRKMTDNAFAVFVRDLLLPFLIPLGATAMQRTMAFRVDRTPLAEPPAIWRRFRPDEFVGLRTSGSAIR
jgi:2-polyprenyl-6-methoxyphenol hydroxylase-like FAD-dependent oxidoreductase